MIWIIIYIVGLIVSAALDYTFARSQRHWLERVGSAVVCLLWPVTVGTCIIATAANAWGAFVYRKRAKASGDWRP